MKMHDEIFDIEIDESALARRTPQLSDAFALQIPKLDERIKNMVVVRESAIYDHTLMDGCIQHTLSYCKSLPGYETARSLGLTPLLAPETLPPEVMAIPLSSRKSMAVLWTVDGTAFLYSEASAASTDSKGDNHWTAILNTTLERFRPERLHAVSMSRLVRSFSMAGLVQNVVATYVDEVIAGGQHIIMRGRRS